MPLITETDEWPTLQSSAELRELVEGGYIVPNLKVYWRILSTGEVEYMVDYNINYCYEGPHKNFIKYVAGIMMRDEGEFQPYEIPQHEYGFLTGHRGIIGWHIKVPSDKHGWRLRIITLRFAVDLLTIESANRTN